MAPNKQYNVTVVGATGMVGRVFLDIMVRRHFPVKSLRLLATQRSAGRKILVGEREIEVEITTNDSFAGADFVFISASGEASRQYCPLAAQAGAIAIDDSSAWRMDPKVPLVVPEINADDVDWHQGIISIPNCSTTPIVMCLWPIHRVNPVKRVIADTYQSVSGTGKAAVDELNTQTAQVLDGKDTLPHVYPHQIAFNLLPHIDVFLDNGYTKEEWKMVNETRKIMHDDSIAVSATCVRVPVLVSHSAAVHVELTRPMSADEVRDILAEAPGVTVQDETSVNLYPQPWSAAGQDDVFVGRIRQDASHPNGIAMWVVSDNLRKGAALNAIQIAEEVINRNLV
ncbi:MAG: aspartate-semialdehyde dehydrogenase [Dehalococcoidia bacterium]|nr:aspartate-semialdehyde dehydrogenase [Dehalococcoidia bacterium]